MGTDYDYRSIQMTFSRNIPANLVEVADVINKVGHLLSKETQINLLPIDVEAEEEINRIEAEQTAGGFEYDIDE